MGIEATAFAQFHFALLCSDMHFPVKHVYATGSYANPVVHIEHFRLFYIILTLYARQFLQCIITYFIYDDDIFVQYMVSGFELENVL